MRALCCAQVCQMRALGSSVPAALVRLLLDERTEADSFVEVVLDRERFGEALFELCFAFWFELILDTLKAHLRFMSA